MSSETEETSKKTYVIVFVALLALTGVTFGLSFVPLGSWQWPVALGIALAKALLIATFFMHLIELTPSHRLALLSGAVLLAILILFAVADVYTRPYEVGPKPPVTTIIQ